MSLLRYSSMAGAVKFSKISVRCLTLSKHVMDKKPLVAAKQPFMESLVGGKKYSWCFCGVSKKQPFCDGSHRRTGLRPVRIVPEETGDVFFCGCKQTKTAPYCDGSHMSENVQNCTLGECL